MGDIFELSVAAHDHDIRSGNNASLRQRTRTEKRQLENRRSGAVGLTVLRLGGQASAAAGRSLGPSDFSHSILTWAGIVRVPTATPG